ncbi:hypothetical protein DDE82_000010 [Stemphylium lycopersici]|uniref:Uncharacterized protein n=1 Tax=Stemphylium lycopersici TaxID=183478 RepID=A0A364MTB7_STELY|nr:hypothetical protein DDE83_008394 [Stemphylium lycopersici]RAR12300.1 hypothetical protein DDE82_000010 [Stemphylium lycopersici]
MEGASLAPTLDRPPCCPTHATLALEQGRPDLPRQIAPRAHPAFLPLFARWPTLAAVTPTEASVSATLVVTDGPAPHARLPQKEQHIQGPLLCCDSLSLSLPNATCAGSATEAVAARVALVNGSASGRGEAHDCGAGGRAPPSNLVLAPGTSRTSRSDSLPSAARLMPLAMNPRGRRRDALPLRGRAISAALAALAHGLHYLVFAGGSVAPVLVTWAPRSEHYAAVIQYR